MNTRAWLTIDQICEEWGIARSTFQRWLHTGKGPRAVKLPNGKIRIRRSDLEAWIAKLEHDAA